MEFKATLIRSTIDERDYIAESLMGTSPALPETYSLIDQLTPVRDQGEYNTCAAETASCIKEWEERKDVGYNGYMSPQFIYNNRANQPSEGMACRDVMDILYKKGICYESDYPYTTTSPISSDVYTKAKNYVIKSYATVTTVDGLKQALYQNGPCLIAFPVYNFGNRFWKIVGNQPLLGGHAVTVVGYDANGFTIRNSWGTSWNGTGYTNMPYEDWGCQWECWTTIDAKSVPPTPPAPPKPVPVTKPTPKPVPKPAPRYIPVINTLRINKNNNHR